MTPKQSATVHCEILNDEVCLYDWTRQKVHALNPAAARIWQLCDGRTSVEEIARRFESEFGVSHPEVLVWRALADFMDKGLIDADAMVSGNALSRRQLMTRIGLTAAALPVIHSIVAPTPIQAASASSQTFGFTGGSQVFVVPQGVVSITVDAFGAQGSRPAFGARPGTDTGGKGGRATATLVVTPGESLIVNVGGAGSSSAQASQPVGLGGFNGGADGGAFAGGGGGASDVSRGTAKLVVAGGGGGSGGDQGGSGGLGGSLVGGTGGTPSNTNSGQGGGGGTQTGGGAGGFGPVSSGQAGMTGAGGAGASGDANSASNGGGGGGGGYFGGGGGGFGYHLLDGNQEGGGGGGSSFTDSAATQVTHAQGVRSGDGQIVINW